MPREAQARGVHLCRDVMRARHACNVIRLAICCGAALPIRGVGLSRRENFILSRAAKIIITIAVSLVILAASVIGFGLYWWSHHSHELFEAGRKQIEQGEAFGKQTDEQGCLDEAITRYKANRGFSGSISTGLFLRSCLEASRPTPGFCDQVPKQSDILKSARWQIEQAKKAGIDDQYGRQLFTQVQQYCGSKESKSISQQ